MNKLKRNLQIVCVSLFTSLVITSCKDDDKAVEYYAQATIPKFVNPASHGGGNIKLKVSSNVHKNKNLDSKVVFTDDEESVLVSAKGEEIKKGEEFNISTINEEYVYKFNSNKRGVHNVEIKIKNSEGVNYTQKAKVWVKGGYEFNIGTQSATTKVNESVEIDFVYVATDSQAQICDIVKFEIADASQSATINGKEKTEISAEKSLRIVDTGAKKALPLAGKLEYKPTTVGTHVVTITVIDQFKEEKQATFTVDVSENNN